MENTLWQTLLKTLYFGANFRALASVWKQLSPETSQSRQESLFFILGKETRELTYTKQQDVTILILFSMRLSLRWAEKHALLSWILSQVKFASQNFKGEAH